MLLLIDCRVVDAEAVTFSEFESLPAADLSEVISGMFIKTYELLVDALPTAILKTSLDILMMPILHTGVVNLSLSSIVFPDQFKHGCIRPGLLNYF